MAYLRTLDNKCKKCGGLAKCELVDRWNDSRGKYCKRCGEAALKKLQEAESK